MGWNHQLDKTIQTKHPEEKSNIEILWEVF